MVDKMRSGFVLFGIAALITLNVTGFAWLIDGSRLRRQDAYIFLLLSLILSVMATIYFLAEKQSVDAKLNVALVHLHFWPVLCVILFSLYFATHVGVFDSRPGEIHRSSPILFRLATTSEILFGIAQVPFVVNLALLLRKRMRSQRDASS